MRNNSVAAVAQPPRAAILAGGKGTRLSEKIPGVPKPMIPVAGKPLLQYQIEALAAQGIRDITLIVGYKANVIREYFRDGADFGANGVKIEYIVEEEPLGTGGALSLLPSAETLVMMGDLYLDIDISRFIAFHRERGASVSLFAHPNSHPYDSDLIVANESGRVTQWLSKKDERGRDYRNLVNAGLYMFSADALPKGVAQKRDLDRELIAPRIGTGGVYAYRSTEYVKDMGTPERLGAVERDITSGAAAARSLRNAQRAVFLDRDGTITEYDGFITHADQLRLIPGAAAAIKRLNCSGFLTICVTNQPVIARGDVTPSELDRIHARLDTLLGQEGAYLDDLLFCPHHPDKGFAGEVAEYKVACDCRKPKPGMLLAAAKRYNIDLSSSFIVGDTTADMAAGNAAGCVTIGVKTGEGLKDGKNDVFANRVECDLSEAVNFILKVNDD